MLSVQMNSEIKEPSQHYQLEAPPFEVTTRMKILSTLYGHQY